MNGLPSLAALEGRWRMARTIVHDDGGVDRASGIAAFIRAGPRLIQDEDALLTTARGGPPLKATRRYVWGAEGGRIDIAFADMRPFHSIPLGAARPGTVYLCDPDRYEVAYDFSDFPRWSSVWRVDGPRKAYRMETRYERLRDDMS